MRASFQSGRQCQSSFNAGSLAASVLPLCAGSADLQGRAPCLPSSLCAGQSLPPPTLRPPVGQPQPARMGCNKWPARALFWSCGHWWIHTLFSSFVRSTTCLRAQATHIRYLYHLDPHWAAEVAPDPMCWDISRMCVAGHTFTGLP